jgi:hypothetical protein
LLRQRGESSVIEEFSAPAGEELGTAD